MHYQPRVTDLAGLRAMLVDPQAPSRIIGLRGMGGIGKTVLAIALAHDPSLRAKFSFGVAWMTFGRNALALTKAAELATAITGQPTRFDSLSAARGQLGELTQTVALLIILDDIWEPESADPFTGLGPECRAIITTRDTRVFTRAAASQHDLKLLTHASARDFLATVTGLPNADALPRDADAIIDHCGRLPLALTAVGALIRTGTYGWSDSLQALDEGATEEFDTTWLPDPEQRTLAVVLRTSVERLSPEAKTCFLACAAFREDTLIPEAALLRLWSDLTPNSRMARRMAAELEGRSLLNRAENGRYRIHDLYVDFLTHAGAPMSARHAYLVDRYRENYPSGWEHCPDDGYILRYLPWHLREAGNAQELQNLLFCHAWLRHKLSHTDINALIADYALLPTNSEAATVSAALVLSAYLLAREKDQLASHLVSRLVPANGANVARLLHDIRSSGALAPTRVPYLSPPGAELRRCESHLGMITAVGVAPDCRRVLSANGLPDRPNFWRGATISVWDIETGTELHRLDTGAETVAAIEVCADGKNAVSAGVRSEFGLHVPKPERYGTVSIWDIETGAELRRVEHQISESDGITVFATERRIFLLEKKGTLRLLNLDTGEELCRLEGHTEQVNAVALLRNGRHALSGASDRTLRLWDLETSTELVRFEGHNHSVSSLAVLRDERRALSGSLDGTLRLWDLETGTELRRLEGHTSVGAIAVLPDGRLAVSADGSLPNWNPYSRYFNRRVVALIVWDLESGRQLRRLDGHLDSISALGVMPDGRILSGALDKTLRVWNVEIDLKIERLNGYPFPVNSVAILPGQHQAVAAFQSGRSAGSASSDMNDWQNLILLDAETGAELRRFPGHTTAAVFPDGRHALSAFGITMLCLWDLSTGVEVRRFDGHSGAIRSIAILPDGRAALSASEDKTVRLWDITTGSSVREFRRLTGPALSIAVLPDGRQAISGHEPGNFLYRDHIRITTLFLWDVDSGKLIHDFGGVTKAVHCVAVLPEGQFVLTGSDCLCLWDIKTGTQIRRFGDYASPVTSLAVLGDGRRCVSAANDKTLRLWDIESGQELARYIGDVDFTALATVPETNQVLTGNKLGQVVLFQIPP